MATIELRSVRRIDPETIQHQEVNEVSNKDEQSCNYKSTTRENLFVEFYSSVTMHGFRFLFQGNKKRRVLWFLLQISVLSFVTVLFQKLLSGYLQHDISASQEYFFGQETKFPTIKICPYSSISKKKLANLPGNISEPDLFEFLDLLHAKSKINLTEESVKQHSVFKKLKRINITDYGQFLNLFLSSYSDLSSTPVLNVLSDMLHGNNYPPCMFYGTSCPYHRSIHLEWQPNSWCIVFNMYLNKTSNPLIVEPMNSETDGLSLFLDISDLDGKDLLGGPLISIVNYEGMFRYDGVTKSVHGVPGYSLKIKLREQRLKLLPPPYRTNCSSIPYNFAKMSGYQREVCIYECIISHRMANKSCLGNDTWAFTEGVRPCRIEEMKNYFLLKGSLAAQDGRTPPHGVLPGIAALKVLKNQYYEQFTKSCVSQCPPECHQISYHLQSSEIRLNRGRKVIKRLQKNVPGWENKTAEEIKQYIDENIVHVRVSVDELWVASTKYSPSVTWTTLVATIGGSIGFGFGFSILTAFEFIFFFYDYVKLLWKQRVNRCENQTAHE